MPTPAAGDAPAADVFDGRQIGRYRVVRRLGAGGFARVYLAVDPDLDLEVAVKILRPELADDADTVERFRREAGTAARLRHPHVITVLTVGRLDESFDGIPAGAPYLVMDYLPVSLAERVANDATLPEQDAARIGAEVARGLAYAHRQGIVHRDVKPENVLFARDGRAVVTDFGIARAVSGPSAATSRQLLLGTPSFFSPEQARGLPLDGRSDIYGLGVTLFRAATGCLPFGGDDWYEVMRQHIELPVPSAQAVVPSLSPAFDAVLARALAKDPADRFTTGDAMAAALDQSRGVTDRGELTVAVPALPAKRKRRWPTVAAVTTGVAVAGAAALLVYVNEPQPRTAARPTPAATDAAPPLDTRAVADSVAATAPAPPTNTLPAVPPPNVDSAKRPGKTARGTIVVSAPADAEVALDGRVVGRGAWRSASVPPGRHAIRASVAAAPGCTSADTTATVDVLAGGRAALQLTPVRCGYLGLLFTPAPAHYTLTAAIGGETREGVLPLSQPLILPAGDYRLRVEARSCVPYVDDVPVLAGVTRTEQHPLICN